MILSENFTEITPKQWKQQIQFELNGLDYNSTLLWESNGISVKPFYTEEDKNQRYNFIEIPRETPKKSLTDIISEFAKNGNWKNSQKEDFQNLKAELNNKNAITINVSLYENNGANIIQQLAYSLAIIDDYVKYCGKKITKNIQFKFNIGDNFFFEIAKLQAFEILWQKFLSIYEIEQKPICILTQPSLRNVKNSTNDEIYFTTANISANIPKQVIKNTFYIDYLTQQLVEKSFAIYELIKNNGGFIKQLEVGNIQRKIKESALKDNFLPKIEKFVRKTKIKPLTNSFENKKWGFENKQLDIKTDLFLNSEQVSITNHSAGFPPFLRGISATMYTQNLWKNVKISDFSSEKIIISNDDISCKNLELFFIKALEIIKIKLNEGSNIDDICKNLIFSFNINGNFFENIAKLRASRVLWANLIKKFNPKRDKSMAMHIHCEIFGSNISEKTTNTISAIFGGTQSINTDRNIDNHLKNNTFISKVIDPFGGSFFIENMTEQIIKNTWESIIKKL